MTCRVLVADDDPDFLECMVTLLEGSGALVVSATSGADLLERLAENGPFDLVITDVSMPWMTGFQVARTMKDAGLDVPLIVMTGLRDPWLADLVRTLGEHTTLLHKPFDALQLEAAVALVLPAVACSELRHASHPR